MSDHLIAGKSGCYNIWLDGVEVTGVIEAHLTEGWLIRVVYNDDGSIRLDGEDVATVKEFGTVAAEEIHNV